MAIGFLAFTPDLDFPCGEREFRRVLESSPNDAAAKSYLGAALSAQGRLAEAEQTCREALLLDPLRHPCLVQSLDESLWDWAATGKPRKLFRKGLEIQPKLHVFTVTSLSLDIFKIAQCRR